MFNIIIIIQIVIKIFLVVLDGSFLLVVMNSNI